MAIIRHDVRASLRFGKIGCFIFVSYRAITGNPAEFLEDSSI